MTPEWRQLITTEPEPKGARSGWRRRLLLLFGSTGLALVLAEVGLRIVLGGSVEDTLATRQTGSEASRRVLCIGDSYTFGLYYRPEESYPGRLERLLNVGHAEPEWAVVNAGIPAQNTRQILHALPDQLRRFTPEVVILMAGHNNRWNLADPSAGSAWQRFWNDLVLVKMVRIAGAEEDAEGTASRITHWSEDQVAVQVAGQESVIEVDKTLDRRSDEAVIESCSVDFREFVRLVREADAMPVLATYPSPESGYAAPATAARQVAESIGCELIDFRAQFEEVLKDRAYHEVLIPGDRHPNERGYALMARRVCERMVSVGLADDRDRSADPESLYPATLTREGDGRLQAAGPPGAEFQIVVGATDSPPQKFGSHEVPVAADDLFREFQNAAELKGELGDEGRRTIALPSTLAGRAVVAALVVFHDHKLRVPDLMVREISAPLHIGGE